MNYLGYVIIISDNARKVSACLSFTDLPGRKVSLSGFLFCFISPALILLPRYVVSFVILLNYNLLFIDTLTQIGWTSSLHFVGVVKDIQIWLFFMNMKS